MLGSLRTRDWRGLVLTGKPLVFAAGADITQFPGITPERAREGGRAGHELFGRLRELPFPTLAAVNGAALGGGLEIALHCDVRTIASNVRHLGFPEVFLGLFPAWGGTQLDAAARRRRGRRPADRRQPAEAEPPDAAPRRRSSSGSSTTSLEPVEFLDESIELLLRRIEAGEGKREPAADLSDAAEVVRKARARVDDAVHGQAPAPYRALDLIEGAATWTHRGGLRRRGGRARRPAPGPEAQASIYAFDVVERRIKKPAGDSRREAAAGPGGRRRRRRPDGDAARDALPAPARGARRADRRRRRPGRRAPSSRSGASSRVSSRRGGSSEGKARFLGSIVTAGTGPEAYAGCDLVLEAVFEELAVKQEVFGALEQVVSPECLLVTNTSSLSVAAMADGLAHPERVVGLHFFNPVAVLPLVEVVRTPATDDASLATAWDVTRKLGKRGVLVQDAPAFVVNRMLTRQSTVLMQALESGSTFEETDEAALRLGLPMPPSALLAMVGPRVANHVLHTLHDAFPDRFPLSPTLQALADGEFPALEAARRQADGRRDPRADPRGARRRGAADPRRGRRRERRRDRRLPDPRRRLSVLPRRDHEAPRPDGCLAARLGPIARRRLTSLYQAAGLR